VCHSLTETPRDQASTFILLPGTYHAQSPSQVVLSASLAGNPRASQHINVARVGRLLENSSVNLVSKGLATLATW
jgi:hypothetical protein